MVRRSPSLKPRRLQNKLKYQTLLSDEREIPAWIDDVLKMATHPLPIKRYQELSEFIYDLRHPNQAFINKTQPPLIERDPLFFWKSFAFIQMLIIAF